MTQGHWVALFGVTLVLWAILFLMALPETVLATQGLGWLEALCRVTPGTAGWSTAVVMWAIMSVAMMAPTAVPAFATYDEIPGTTPVDLGRLIFGYLAVWVGFAFVAALLQVGLYGAGWLGLFGQSQSIWLTSLLLGVAGLYQFSALKDACLSRCRAPLTFFMSHWDDGAFRNGLRLGADCLGCCWALMLLAFVGGTMNLAFMGLAMVLMTLEKLPEIGGHITRPLGGGLIALALFTPLSLLF